MRVRVMETHTADTRSRSAGQGHGCQSWPISQNDRANSAAAVAPGTKQRTVNSSCAC